MKCPECDSDKTMLHSRWLYCFACKAERDIDKTDELEEALTAMTERAVKAEGESKELRSFVTRIIEGELEIDCVIVDVARNVLGAIDDAAKEQSDG